MFKRLLPIFALSVVLFLALIALPTAQPVQAFDDRVPVFGVMIIHNPTSGCASPIGICFVGTISGNLINGTVSGQANTIKEITNKKGDPIAYTFTGDFTFTTPHGTLTGNANFYQNYPALTGRGDLVITTGTGRFKRTHGELHLDEPNPPVPPQPDGIQTFYYRGWVSRTGLDNHDH